MTLSKLSDKGLDKKALEKLNMGERQKQLLQQLQQELGIDPKSGDDKFGQAQMDQLGLQQYDPSLLNLTDEERDRLRELIQERLNDIEKKLANSQELSPSELKSLLESKQQLQEMQEQLEMSEEMRKALEEFMNSPEFKDIMKAVDKMREAAKQVNEGQPLSEQQIQDLEKMLDDLEQKLEDSKYKDMVMEQMRAALEMLKAGKATCEAGGT
jgi:Zn-dependent M16 (insulinase) family peptidase